jgi:hypothetical protein
MSGEKPDTCVCARLIFEINNIFFFQTHNNKRLYWNKTTKTNLHKLYRELLASYWNNDFRYDYWVAGRQMNLDYSFQRFFLLNDTLVGNV